MGNMQTPIKSANRTKKNMGVTRSLVILGLVFLILCSAIMVTSTCMGERRSDTKPEIKYMKINTVIDNNYATTEITEKFKNPYNYSWRWKIG